MDEKGTSPEDRATSVLTNVKWNREVARKRLYEMIDTDAEVAKSMARSYVLGVLGSKPVRAIPSPRPEFKIPEGISDEERRRRYPGTLKKGEITPMRPGRREAYLRDALLLYPEADARVLGGGAGEAESAVRKD